MELVDTPEEAAFRKEARAWLEERAPAKGGPDDFESAYRDESLPQEEWVRRCKGWQRILSDGGWACITWPEEYGGRGGTPREEAIFAEEQSRFGVSNGAFAVGIGMVGPTIIAHGSEAQKERFLPALLRGEEVWCQLFSEPGAGSDMANLRTRAVRHDGEWIVNGQKVWTSGAHHSEWGILLARTDPDVPKHRGITYFLLDMRSEGIEVRPLRQMTGGSHFNEVFLTDVRIPDDDLSVLGDVNDGWRVAMTTLGSERAFIGGGSNAPRYEDLVELARAYDRRSDATIRQEIAAAYTREQILKYLGLRLQAAQQRGEPPGREASVMKLFYASHLKQTCELALKIQGPDATLAGEAARDRGAWQGHFLQAPAIRIAGGSDEVQRNIVAERVLGLPRGPRVDKDVPFRDLP